MEGEDMEEMVEMDITLLLPALDIGVLEGEEVMEMEAAGLMLLDMVEEDVDLECIEMVGMAFASYNTISTNKKKRGPSGPLFFKA